MNTSLVCLHLSSNCVSPLFSSKANLLIEKCRITRHAGTFVLNPLRLTTISCAFEHFLSSPIVKHDSDIVYQGDYSEPVEIKGQTNLIVKDSTFKNIKAGQVYGGAICFEDSSYALSVRITGSTFTNCSAIAYGGVIYTMCKETRIEKCCFSQFTTNIDGQAVYIKSNDEGSVLFTNTLLFDSEMQHDKTIYLFGGDQSMKLMNFSKLVYPSWAGKAAALGTSASTKFAFSFCSISCLQGKGATSLTNSRNKELSSLSECNFVNNSVGKEGLIYIGDDWHVHDCVFSQNTGILVVIGGNPQGFLLITNCTTDSSAYFTTGSITNISSADIFVNISNPPTFHQQILQEGSCKTVFSITPSASPTSSDQQGSTTLIVTTSVVGGVLVVAAISVFVICKRRSNDDEVLSSTALVA